jgi:hypothetical protein
MAAADVSLQALRHVIDGDVPGAFIILTDHIREAAIPTKEMFNIAWGFAAMLPGDCMFGGLDLDDADLARSLVGATKTGDIEGAYMAWLLADIGSCGGALGGLLAAAAQSVLRRMGE